MARSVLLTSDQVAGRYPDRCVLSGEPTDRVVTASAVRWTRRRWLLGIPGLVPLLGLRGRQSRAKVTLPVAAPVWRRWQRRDVTGLCLLVAGVVLAIGGIVRREAGLVIIGLLVAVAAGAYRTRAARNYWVTCCLDRDGRTVSIDPTCAAFDRQAQQLFERSLRR